MNAFIFISSSYDEYEVIGAYTSLKKAQKAVKDAFDKINASSNDNYTYELVKNAEYSYSVYRNKTHEFTDGLIDRVYIETYLIKEMKVM